MLACTTLFFSNCGGKVDDQEGINSFLSLVSLQIKGQQAQDLLKNFDMPKKKLAIVHLVKLLCNLNGVEKNSKPIFKVDLNIESDTLTKVSNGATKVVFPVKFSRDSIREEASSLAFKIKKGKDGKYKIVDVEATKFSSDYVYYENLVRMSTLTDKDIYDPITLEAFKTADSMKAKYDSIPWFQHIGSKTYFFVVKGQLNADMVLDGGHRDTALTYKMGMVDPDQKEIIPVEYDLIHNIGATFPDLIEVEKSHKRGFYNLSGQNVLPVEYDEIFPVDESDNLALLRKGDDYYWLKKDLTTSDKADIKIAEVLPKIQAYGKSFDLKETVMKNITECNSKDNPESIYFPPSYMVDWHLLPYQQNFKNPLRRNVQYEDASELYTLKFEGKTDVEGWLSSVFYSITDHYLGGREGLYDHKNVLVINKNKNRIYGADIQTDMGEGEGLGRDPDEKDQFNQLRSVNDSLYEIKVGSVFYVQLQDNSVISKGPGYHYLVAKNDKLVELKTERIFGFTKYVKMDDTYLKDHYGTYDKPEAFTVNKEILSYMKNEIYGEYHYKFKDKFWQDAFQGQYQYFDKPLNDNVDDSLTVIDKYNIAFINKKLQQQTAKPKVLAAK